LRYLTAGESHGKAIVTIVEGLPSQLPLTVERLEEELARRRLGYGRGGRMKIEADHVEILSGVRYGRTLGSPLCAKVENLDYLNWLEAMSTEPPGRPVEPLTVPRPGHADLAGSMKYGTRDIRDILERASARETLGRVLAGTVARVLLEELGIEILSHVTGIGDVDISPDFMPAARSGGSIDESPLRCLDASTETEMMGLIDAAKEDGDSLGGRFQVVAFGVPPGLGSHVQWDRRADGLLAQAVMSIPAIKSVYLGRGEEVSRKRGSQAQDPIAYGPQGWTRPTNNAGGLEGGITNGQPLVVNAAMKPIPTIPQGLPSVDLVTKEQKLPAAERADTCAVPAAAVVAESAVAWVLAALMVEKMGGDTLSEIKSRYKGYLAYLKDF